MYRKRDCVSLSKPGVEYAIDWSLADSVLKAMATLAGSQGGGAVLYSEVIATAGLSADKTDELMRELAVLGLATTTTSDGKTIDGACIAREGLSRLAGRPAVAYPTLHWTDPAERSPVE
jgi:hypothetical protein